VEAHVGGYPTWTPRNDLARQRDRSDRYIKSLSTARAVRVSGRCSMSATRKHLPQRLAPKRTPAVATTHRLLSIAAIRVGERHRKEMGDIDALARSISENGLLHPIVVSEKN
jgi:hypothetical protein